MIHLFQKKKAEENTGRNTGLCFGQPEAKAHAAYSMNEAFGENTRNAHTHTHTHAYTHTRIHAHTHTHLYIYI